MSAHLDLHLSCFCGGVLEDVNQSHTAPYRTVLVLRCEQCRRDLALEVVLSVMGGSARDWGEFGVSGVRDTCGTEWGYRVHRTDGENPCERCTAAFRAAKARRRKKAREVAA